MIQKIIKVGNSAAVTIPKECLTDLGASVGDSVTVKYRSPNSLVVKVDGVKKAEAVIDPEVHRVAKGLLKRYLPAFKELNKR